MKRLMVAIALLFLPALASAQITPPYTFTAGTPILSSQVNANFAMFADALNRTGGTITGNITVAAGITIDGVDISDLASPSTFEAADGGSAENPPFGFADDPGTGMWSSANDRLDWALNEITYMYLTTSGLNLTGSLTASGNLTIGASKFTVDAATGNIITLGNLSVGGTITGNATGFTGSLSGDVTSVGMATTLATVNANVGTFGNGTTIPVITVNAKGLVTAVTTSSVSAGSTLPLNMIAFFPTACTNYSGWSEYTNLRGRYPVGVISGGTVGAVGTAFTTDTENRAVGQHNHADTFGHTVTEPNSGQGHRHSVALDGTGATDGANDSHDYVGSGPINTGYATTDISIAHTGSISNEGSVSGTNAPYYKLFACQYIGS